MEPPAHGFTSPPPPATRPPTQPTSTPAISPADRWAGPSRRGLLLGGGLALGLAAAGGSAAAGISAASVAPQGDAGRLVPDLLDGSSFTVAHRGGGADWPEMSMKAYRTSVLHGANALEVSLARSSDGVWFGLHDASLDRTSMTSGFVAAQHTWAEISRYRITAQWTRDRTQEAQPYMRFEDLIAAYAGTHTIFVDPKAVKARYHPELLRMMTSVPHPADTFVGKAYCTGRTWARAVRAEGMRTWGFYYGQEIESGKTPLVATQAEWDLLGLDVKVSAATWSAIRSFGKPVIAHVVASRARAGLALANGAAGLMVSGVRAVLGEPGPTAGQA